MINLNEMKRDYIGREPRDYIVESVTVPEGLEEKVLAAMTQKRKEIEEIQKEKQEKKAAHKSVALRAAVIAAVITLMILIIPSSRQVVVSAAESVIKWFQSLRELEDTSQGCFPIQVDYDGYDFTVNDTKSDNGFTINFVGAVVADDTLRIGLYEEFDINWDEEWRDFRPIYDNPPAYYPTMHTEYLRGTITDSEGHSVDFRSTSVNTMYSKYDTYLNGNYDNNREIMNDGLYAFYAIPVDNLLLNLNHDFANYTLSFTLDQYYLNFDELSVSQDDYIQQPYLNLYNNILFGQKATSTVSFVTKVKNTKLLENTVVYPVSCSFTMNNIVADITAVSISPISQSFHIEYSSDDKSTEYCLNTLRSGCEFGLNINDDGPYYSCQTQYGARSYISKSNGKYIQYAHFDPNTDQPELPQIKRKQSYKGTLYYLGFGYKFPDKSNKYLSLLGEDEDGNSEIMEFEMKIL